MFHACPASSRLMLLNNTGILGGLPLRLANVL
jgi:hypothetical protein